MTLTVNTSKNTTFFYSCDVVVKILVAGILYENVLLGIVGGRKNKFTLCFLSCDPYVCGYIN